MNKDIYSLRDEWLVSLDHTENTILTYKQATDRFLKFLNECNRTRPTETLVDVYLSNLKLEVKPTTYNIQLYALKSFFNFLNSKKYCCNFLRKKKRVEHAKKSERKSLTEQQVKTLLEIPDRNSLDGKRDYLMLLLMVTTGLRISSISLLDKDDITDGNGKYYLHFWNKGNHKEKEVIEIDSRLFQILHEYAMDLRQNEPAMFLSYSTQNYGKRIGVRAIQQRIKKLMKEAGISDRNITAHSLRHTTATLAIDKGSSIDEIKDLLKHTGVEATYLYLHQEEDKTSPNSKLVKMFLE